MFRRTTSILYIKSASLLYPVNSHCCFALSSSNSRCLIHGDLLDGVKKLALLRCLSTAAERYTDAQIDPACQRQYDGYHREMPNVAYTDTTAGFGKTPRGIERRGSGSSNWNQDPNAGSVNMGQEGVSGNDRMELKGEKQNGSQAYGHQLGYYHQKQNVYHAEYSSGFHQRGDTFGQNKDVNHGVYAAKGAFQQNLIENRQHRGNGFVSENGGELRPDGYLGRVYANKIVDSKENSNVYSQVKETHYNQVGYHHIPDGGHSAATNVSGDFRGVSGQASQFSYSQTGYQQRMDGSFEKSMPFQNKPNDYNMGNDNYQPSTSFMSDGTNYEKPLIEDVEHDGYRGTLDELDGLCKERKLDEAVKVLDLLEKQGILVDLPRYFQLFQICGDTRSLDEAKNVHGHLFRALGKVETNVYNKILEMYSRCGSMEDACELFETMPFRNLTSWDTMIMGFANNGLGEDAIDFFTQFKQKGLTPDSSLFVTVFHACGVLGAINEGMLHFQSMSKEYGIIPAMEHYVGIVDMLGEAGHLEEALEFIDTMPYEPSVCAWEKLMNHCRVHGDINLGDHCAQIVEKIDPSRLTHESRSGLVPLKSSDLAKNEKKKTNLLEVRKMHEYRAGDRSHPERERIYAQIHSMAHQMREAGYVPETRFVLHDVDQETKEEALLYHSEKLATAYSLISTPARSQIRIIKNLRICVDCHNALKIVSKLSGRRFIVRDVKRFHHMENGVCTCNDYW